MLKLIALRPLSECSPHALKCLHENETYYFCNLLCVAENGNISWRNDSDRRFHDDDLYKINDEVSKISISAIVGKNGDGKSSIIELTMRLINNYASSTLSKMKDPDTLVKVKDVCAELFFLLDRYIYKLYDHGDGNAKLEKIASFQANGSIVMFDEPERIDGTRQLADNFFYTMVSNYSHHSYNIYDFRSEWVPASGFNQTSDERCWLYHIFHKNDGYRTPLVLNPYRNKGNIDVNREKFLTQQRLISLFLDAENPEKGKKTFRHIYGKVASHIAMEDPGISKLQEKTIKDYFIGVKNESLLGSIIIQTKNLANKETVNNSDISESLLLLQRIYNTWISPNISLLNKIKKWDSKEKEDNVHGEERGFLIENSDLANWIQELQQVNFKGDEENKKKMLKKIEPYKNFNILQLQRIGLINLVCTAMSGKTISCQISHEDQFRLTSAEISHDYSKLSIRKKCEHYIIYKIISIFETYIEEYKKPCRFFGMLIVDFEIPSTYVNNAIAKLWVDLKKHPSHITLKLRQALYYRIHYLTRSSDKFEKLASKNCKEAERVNAILKKNGQFEDSLLIIPLDKLKEEIADSRNLEQLPPPIYYSHVVFTSTEDADKIMTMDTLSSGEKQRLITISGIIYHLRNINTIDIEGIKYHNVNIVLEEIELYFHPESQRLFISELVEMIERVNLTEIQNIHLLFVTHSPFVLSDIPSSNVLMLEKGRFAEDTKVLKTFGANIYEMLDTGFFMGKGAIGGFTMQHISEIIDNLNKWYHYVKNNKKNDNTEPKITKQALYDMIMVVDDRIIRESLMLRYDDVFGQANSVEEEIRELEERIKKLKQKMENHVVPPES